MRKAPAMQLFSKLHIASDGVIDLRKYSFTPHIDLFKPLGNSQIDILL